jgi:hypothetical protein
MLSRIYLAAAILIIALYGVLAFTGKEFGDPRRQIVPEDARKSPGGYRSFHYLHSGYRGGK